MFELSSTSDGLICPPVEICTYVMSLDEGIVGSQRILVHHDYLTNNQFHRFPQTSGTLCRFKFNGSNVSLELVQIILNK